MKRKNYLLREDNTRSSSFVPRPWQLGPTTKLGQVRFVLGLGFLRRKIPRNQRIRNYRPKSPALRLPVLPNCNLATSFAFLFLSRQNAEKVNIGFILITANYSSQYKFCSEGIVIIIEKKSSWSMIGTFDIDLLIFVMHPSFYS